MSLATLADDVLLQSMKDAIEELQRRKLATTSLGLWNRSTMPSAVREPPSALSPQSAPLTEETSPLEDSNGERFFRVCKNRNRTCTCFYYPTEHDDPEDDTKPPIDHRTLHVSGLDSNVHFSVVRQALISAIGDIVAKTVHVPSGRAYAIITFFNHAQAAAAQQRLYKAKYKVNFKRIK